MSLRHDESGSQEIIGFMLAMAAVMLLFGASVGYGVAVRDERVDEAAEVAVDDIARRLGEAILQAATWAETYPDASLSLSVLLPHMPGATGFLAEPVDGTLYVNATSGAQALRSVPANTDGVISGTPAQALVRWDPVSSTIILETA